MGLTAYVFPGQGAQSVGMGADICRQHEGTQALFRAADETLGYPLSELIFQGPEDELKLTYHTQPALLATSCAYLESLRDSGLQPDYVAGHSLGEYSALVCAGVMSFTDAVRTVRLRGEFMDQAVPAGQGAMAAVLGADREALAALCREVSEQAGTVEMANVNCPGQIVVSGTAAGVQAIVERGKEIGARRVVPLEVSGPFHSSLMEPAASRLREVLQQVEMRDAAVPVVANVTAGPVTKAEEIRELLVRQVVSPVLWEDSINWLLSQGVDTFVEIGSGSVLTGLIRKIDRSAAVYTVNSVESLEAAIAALKNREGK
ncbi:malonyl CoA-acyl carrier protein transacylase [Insulibacter thermoxylanivorax]|uniref:Malonyl CoA-acyl carrier protein transacylase n=1 Tax=Insulibacter thermoxylanivorax TaxID=2749268 RepID=A0A916QFW3_9BACL|nr:ACP S-malonyltransferase [Insulibacter thermoxylanivorax]GFR37771.1 malonyl CoA-acyl carrier protein transacylase [Insulibacter thermoxylanivorax]